MPRREAEARGWAVMDEFVRADSEVSGATLNQRDALASLLDDAKKRPGPPFDYLFIDDTSRLGRNLTDVLKISEVLRHAGVFLYFVSQRLDSRDTRTFRQLLIVNGMMDEQYLVGLADKVHRGQEGRVLKGFVAGGRCYGYRNVAIEDLSRMGEYGRPAIIGVRQEVNEAEAVVVRRMFDLYGSGRASLSKIAKIFNREKVPPPRPRTGFDPGWTHNGIRDMLRNERYIGMVVWNGRRQF